MRYNITKKNFRTPNGAYDISRQKKERETENKNLKNSQN